MARPKKPAIQAQDQADPSGPKLYTLAVFLVGGPITEKFAEKNPTVSRTIQIRGDQTLADLHDAIFDAFGRWESHMYEFQFGKKPMDPKNRRYVMPTPFDMGVGMDEDQPPAGVANLVRVDQLKLKKGGIFFYWFDFGDDWWHEIEFEAVDDKVPRGKFPKVIKKVGRTPPQYAPEEE